MVEIGYVNLIPRPFFYFKISRTQIFTWEYLLAGIKEDIDLITPRPVQFPYFKVSRIKKLLGRDIYCNAMEENQGDFKISSTSIFGNFVNWQ